MLSYHEMCLQRQLGTRYMQATELLLQHLAQRPPTAAALQQHLAQRPPTAAVLQQHGVHAEAPACSNCC